MVYHGLKSSFACFLSSADFFQNQLLSKILPGIHVPSEYQAVWIQIRSENLSLQLLKSSNMEAWYYVSPLQGQKTWCFSPRVCPSVCHEIMSALQLESRLNILMKLNTFVKHMNHNSCLYIFQIIFLGILVNAILCPFCKLNTVKAIWMKLHTVVEHNETVCHVQEP